MMGALLEIGPLPVSLGEEVLSSSPLFPGDHTEFHYLPPAMAFATNCSAESQPRVTPLHLLERGWG